LWKFGSQQCRKFWAFAICFARNYCVFLLLGKKYELRIFVFIIILCLQFLVFLFGNFVARWIGRNSYVCFKILAKGCSTNLKERLFVYVFFVLFVCIGGLCQVFVVVWQLANELQNYLFVFWSPISFELLNVRWLFSVCWVLGVLCIDVFCYSTNVYNNVTTITIAKVNFQLHLHFFVFKFRV